jgi:dTDP-4-dehydrorhamnose 3,5-epimerase
MLFTPTPLPGVVLVTPDRFADERGVFAVTWDQAEFASHGIQANFVQRNLSANRAAATLRGMHFQHAPHAQAKLVTCLAGAVYDVTIDLRPDSPTYRQWFGAELRAETSTMLYIPEGFAHGFETLEPDSTIEYLMVGAYAPTAADGVRWDDPAFNIRWPMAPEVMAERDRTWPNLRQPN